jgi:Type II CAAX prenyl endopeptidase Rce1-like
VAKSRPDQQAVPGPGGYFRWSRDPAVGLFAVVPLWLMYEWFRFRLTPAERNGAEMFLLDVLGMLGPRATLVLRIAFVLCVGVAAISLVRRHIPWLRVALVSALEGTIYGLLLGPLATVLASGANRLLTAHAAAGHLDLTRLVGALGAGIFEELVFRLMLMSALAFLFLRATRAFALPGALAGLGAVMVSALVFAAFHNWCGEPFQTDAFLFRTMAGVLLGLLMWTRGYGICVYAHTLYDVYFFLTHPA